MKCVSFQVNCISKKIVFLFSFFGKILKYSLLNNLLMILSLFVSILFFFPFLDSFIFALRKVFDNSIREIIKDEGIWRVRFVDVE